VNQIVIVERIRNQNENEQNEGQNVDNPIKCIRKIPEIPSKAIDPELHEHFEKIDNEIKDLNEQEKCGILSCVASQLLINHNHKVTDIHQVDKGLEVAAFDEFGHYPTAPERKQLRGRFLQ
jgi:hypothetical protein